MLCSYNKILIPIDGSKESIDALYKGFETAKRNNSKVYIVYVSESSPFIMDEPDIDYNIRKKIEILLDNVKKSIPAYIYAEVYILHGKHKETIIKYANKKQVDLIVIGSTGLGKMDRILIGSTTTYVINHASCNVLVVK